MTLSSEKDGEGSGESVWSSGEESGADRVPSAPEGALDDELADAEASEAEEAEEFSLAELEAESRKKTKKGDKMRASHSAGALLETDTLTTRTRRRRRRKLLYLFARSSREKEHWFHRLRQAACQQTFRNLTQKRPSSEGEKPKSDVPLGDHHHSLESSSSVPVFSDDQGLEGDGEGQGKERGESSSSSSEEKTWEKVDMAEEVTRSPLANEWVLYSTVQKEFEWYMKHLMKQSEGEEREKGCMDLGVVASKSPLSSVHSSTIKHQQLAWANAFASRIFYDFSRDHDWINRVRDRIQRKLSTIRLPYFIETLSLSQLDPGLVTPKILSVHEPSLNEWGLWVDLEVQYSGGIQLVLETKINLMKLKSGSLAVTTQGPSSAQHSSLSSTQSASSSAHFKEGGGSRYSDSEIPESPESSPDEDNAGIISNLPFNKDKEGTPKESAGKKLLSLVEKVSQSQFFQDATDNKFVRKAMQTISETPLILTVEVLYLEGTMTVNIPLPPSDRLWYAFRRPPVVTLRAQPRVGEKVVGMTQITDWIQNRLRLLLEKNLVIPNMDDIIVPVMSGNKMFTQFNK